MLYKTLCCIEAIDKLTNKSIFLVEEFESDGGYLEEKNEDIIEIIKAFNMESELRNEYEAIDVFCAINQSNGNILWETKYS